MMNFDLAARALAFGCQVALMYGMLSITAAGAAAIGGLVMDSIAAAPSTFRNSVRGAMKSSEAKAEASRRRVRIAASVVLALVLLCFGGLVASAAASSSLESATNTVAPSTLALTVVVSVAAFAAYVAVEFFVIVASVVVTAAATFVAEIVQAAPSARTTFDGRIDAVMFELIGKWVCNSIASVPKAAPTPKIDVAPKTMCVAAAPETTRPAATVPEKKPNKKTVSFGTVQVQEYRVTLGDHPLCKRYPMTMDWSHTEATEVEVDAYEQAKSSKGRRPRMDARDRQVRIAEVTGVCPKVVQEKEHRRRRKLESANKASATTPEPSTPRKPKKNVSFGKVEIREYSLTLGDHPCCDSYPLSLDWGHTKAKTYDLELLEQAKSEVPRPDLTPKQRLDRIAAVTGYEPSVIEKKERRRVRKLEAAKRVAAEVVQRQPEAPKIAPVQWPGKSLGGFHEV